MNIEEKKEGAVLTAKPLEKRIDASSATLFKGLVIDIINRGNFLIVLDLSEVDFIDSSGLGAIVSIFKTIGNRGDLALCNAQGAVMSLFKLTRMNKVFQIFTSEDEAVSFLAKKNI